MGQQEPNARKVVAGPLGGGCPVRHDADGVWRVDGYAAGRAVLRSTGTVQAGLGIEMVEKLPSSVRRPVLYRDGPEHREHRRQTARYFTPRRVAEHYRGMMERVADEQIARLRAAGSADLSELSFRLAVDVAAEVIGLTESRPGLMRRLERFFPDEFGEPGFTSLRGLRFMMLRNSAWLRMHFGDVRPAVRARRHRRRDDLVSHLLDEGCSAGEILAECLTFAAAGMVTTREFVNVAAWHLFDDEQLLQQYRSADRAGRTALLHEILRLEPAVTSLWRRTTEDLEIPAGGDGADPAGTGPVTVPAGALVEIRLDRTNTDASAVGPRAGEVCPARATADGADAYGLSFGGGPHKCPGAHIAIQESDIFLTRLFAEPGLRPVSTPRVGRKDNLGAYEIRDMRVTLDGNTGSPAAG